MLKSTQKNLPFTPVDSNKKLSQTEEEILKFWEDNNIFEKSVENRKTDDDSNGYSFYDGPPFATGLPHYGHIVGTILKDVIPRYWTMKGKYIPRKWGWDCHGLPIENIVEKELGSKTKKEIEKLGVDKFNELCRSKVLEYADEWEKIIPRLGRWADMKNPYRTMDKSFMESVWWVFKQLWDKDLIYYSYRSMHICPRCETTLSQSEVSEGYKDVKDLSVITKFELKDPTNLQIGYKSTNTKDERSGGMSEAVERGDSRSNEQSNKTFILAWTTTPWTLPGNVALAVGEDIDYVMVEKILNSKSETNPNDKNSNLTERYILAKDLMEKVLGEEKNEKVFLANYKIVEELKGADLVGLKYKPLWDIYAQDENLENKENGWKVVGADFVTTDEGTGVVHIAPAFGEDDMALGKDKNLPFIQHVGMDGIVDEKVEAIGGLNVKPIDNPQATDVEVIKYLAGKGLLFHKEKYEHSYPHCWRCDTPLINYATGSWFVAVTKIKENLLENAKDINWTPEHLKKGRWGKWLEGGRDWSISRQRFWASVMPIWKCQGEQQGGRSSRRSEERSDGRPACRRGRGATSSLRNQSSGCEHTVVFGNVADLEKISGEKIDDLHKHIVDKITFKCSECGGEMHRVPDVLDTWFDSGSMPYGQGHYPFENKDKFEKTFPADFIAEGIDQTRAWFYYLHIIAGGIFNSQAFKNVIVNGIVLAEDGQKMAKKLQNYPDPMEMVNKYGADPLRFYLAQSPVVNAQDLNFSEKDLAEVARGTFRMLWQSYSFFVMYANIDKFTVHSSQFAVGENLLDRWIISELHQLIKGINKKMEGYRLMQATRLFAPFVDNLSNWYIRRSRKRFWKSEDDDDKNEAYATLHYVLVKLSKLLAPFAPFISEEIYKNLTGEESVHLADFPVADDNLIDEAVNKSMAEVREIIKVGLQLRAKNQLKVRQPLDKLKINNVKLKISKELIGIIKEELNVKNVVFEEFDFDEQAKNMGEVNGDTKLFLDIEITPELKMEGQAREIIRAIQQMRKEADYQLDDRIKVGYDGLDEVFNRFSDLISHETLANSLTSNKLDNADLEKEIKIDDKAITLWIKK